MRFSALFIPTLRDDPSDAEIASHRLMVRAGMIRRVAAGIYNYLPLGWRAVQKVERVVREEMANAGAQEIRMPAAQPAELWQETGRWEQYGKELLRFRDRHQREFCLGPTHEEVITDLVRDEVRSYKELPLNLFQIQTKFRDEIRPRFGLMRGREFIMKDGYSFDADVPSAEATYETMRAAYHRIFSRLGFTYRAVEADSGQIGGNLSHEFMVLTDSGEDEVVFCNNCDYAANAEKAVASVAAPEPVDTPEMITVDTPALHTVEEVAGHLNIAPERLIKTLIFALPEHNGKPGRLVAALVRGDRTLNEVKLANVLGVTELTLATDEQILTGTGGPVGFSGPVGLQGIQRVIDPMVAALTDAVTGANAADQHHQHVLPGRDFEVAKTADITTAEAGDGCVRCEGGSLQVQRGTEVGHIFMLGDKYSAGMEATFLDQNGKKKPFVMGCYGIGISRIVAASAEQHHDDKGLCWPLPVAPFEVALLALNMKSEPLKGAAESLYKQLIRAGIDVLYDDRPLRVGAKITDGELLGTPFLVMLGERGLAEGVCEIRERVTGETTEVPLEDAVTVLIAKIRESPHG